MQKQRFTFKDIKKKKIAVFGSGEEKNQRHAKTQMPKSNTF